MNKLTGYELSRKWFDFSFENPDIIKPIHTAIYFFAIEHNNRLGWRNKFGFPTTMVMDAVGVKSYNTYINALNELVEFGFIEMIEKSKNQYSANIIALSKYNKALDKALDKAFIKHATKQSESTIQSTVSIDKQLNNKPIKQLTIDYEEIKNIFNSVCVDLPKVKTLTNSRKKVLQLRIKETSLEAIGELFQKVKESDFLNGKNNTSWNANFDWILKSSNFTKILEDNYKNKDNEKNRNGNKGATNEEIGLILNKHFSHLPNS